MGGAVGMLLLTSTAHMVCVGPAPRFVGFGQIQMGRGPSGSLAGRSCRRFKLCTIVTFRTMNSVRVKNARAVIL